MGGFVYLAKAPGEALASLQRRRRGSLDAMRAKLLPLVHVLDCADFALFVFGKQNEAATPVATFPGGGFAVAVGTLLHRGRSGAAVLTDLYQNANRAPDLVQHLVGNFAALIYKDGVLLLFNDYHGIYAIFSDSDRQVISSSFLATLAAVKRPRISIQEVYEYLFDGTTYGEGTAVMEVQRLDPSAVHRLPPQPARIPKLVDAKQMPRTFDEHVEAASASLVELMRELQRAFDDRLLVSLSGGYDSRLLLAAAVRAHVRPRAFVGGPSDSADVRVAMEVARAARIKITHHDPKQHAVPLPDAFPAAAQQLFHYCDGMGIRGAVYQGAEVASRVARLGGGVLEVNGSGGEIYRDFWKLPEWRRTAKSFATKVLLFKNLGKLGVLTKRFRCDAYAAALEEKLRRSLRAEASAMSSVQVSSLYTILRSESFAGPSNKEMNLLGYSLLPFTLPHLTLQAYTIPLRYRAAGRLEAAIIRHLSPTLASVPSIYGHDFSGAPPLRDRISETLQRYSRDALPLRLVSFLHRRYKTRMSEEDLPVELSERYLQALFGRQPMHVEAYVQLQRLRELGDPEFLSRALTLEMLFRTLERN